MNAINQSQSLVSIGNLSKEQLNQYSYADWIQHRGLLKLNDTSYQPTYEETLRAAGDLFKKTIEGLESTDIYFDIGAGNGVAMMQYRRLFPEKASVMGVAFTQPNHNTVDAVISKDRSDDKFSFYLCNFMHFPTESLKGRVAVATDILGALRYGGDPARVIQQVGAMLKDGGLVFFKFCFEDKIKIPQGYNLESLTGEKESSDLFHYWFYTIRGFDVLQEGMSLEESKKYIKIEVVKKVACVATKCFGDAKVVVLRRNSSRVEVDPLILEEPSKVEMKLPWRPKYRWELSKYSQAMLIQNETFEIF